jgi:hypothetical protein
MAKKALIKLKNIKKNAILLILLAIGIVVGLAVMYLYFQPKLAYQEKIARNWANIASKNQTLATKNLKDAVTYKGQLASASAEIKTLLNKPPQVIYKTQYVQTPADYVAPKPVTYFSAGNGQSYGSNGSWCFPNGTTTTCSGGH